MRLPVHLYCLCMALPGHYMLVNVSPYNVFNVSPEIDTIELFSRLFVGVMVGVGVGVRVGRALGSIVL